MLGVTSEGNTSHLHRCVCPHMVPEECSLPNSLHLFAFFTLHSPLKSSTGAEAPSKAMKLPGI